MAISNRMSRMGMAALVLLAASAGLADTVYMKDGSTLDGIVKQTDAEKVVVEIGKGQTILSAADVARIEKNDKTGSARAVSILRAKEHNAAVDQRSGLNAQQREIVRAAVEPLWSPDEAVRNAGRKKLVAMSKEINVFQYLESTLPYTKDIIAPEIMRTLVEIDPVKAKDVVLPFTQSTSPVNRAKALELAGTYKSDEDLDTIARGLVDNDSAVRAAAAHAIAAAGGKRATPALIAGLNNADPKVQNASRDALKQLWSDSGTSVDFATPGEWTSFWGGKSGEVENPIDTSALVPLVSPDALATATASNDE